MGSALSIGVKEIIVNYTHSKMNHILVEDLHPEVMSHSIIYCVRNFFINDIVVGELGFNVYVEGHFGVPVIMVAGDDGPFREAEVLIPSVNTAAVKE
ncbi:M55 family metallopeptidase [Psychrobacillus sp. L4]|uniref:M55 family metallopeptidase n=1 Tax=Psychrobacillus sp. L4 TaxID=3236892 RepID=UPI0036F24FFA